MAVAAPQTTAKSPPSRRHNARAIGAPVGKPASVRDDLQRRMGNQALQRMLQAKSKLTVNTPGDVHEREADRIADAVMRMPEPELQRTCACGGECPACRTAPGVHEHVQMKQLQSGDLSDATAPDIVHEVLNSAGQPLDAGIDPKIAEGGKTKWKIAWGNISVKSLGQKITSFSGPGNPILQIQTSYAKQGIADETSGYGRGTTPEDIAGGRVSSRSTTLRFHEGSHGLDELHFVEQNPAPRFTGTATMTVSQFEAAIAAWNDKAEIYRAKLDKFTTQQTDCVGTTIDEFHRSNGESGATYTLECGT